MTPSSETSNAEPRHQTFDWLRSTWPVFHDDASKSLFLTRYTDVRNILNQDHLRDPDQAEPGTFLTSAKPDTPWRPEDRTRRMGWLDDPEHHRIRTPIAYALQQRTKALRRRIEGMIDETLDGLAQRRGFDLVRDFALPIPLRVISALLGVDHVAPNRLKRLSEGMWHVWQSQRSAEQESAMAAANAEFADILDEVIAARRITPGEDIVSDLVAVQRDGAPISDSEIRVNCIELLVGGHMTTTDFIGNLAWLILTHPDEQQRLAADPSRIGAVMDEALRFEPPVESVHRIASRDLEVSGCPVHRGQVLAVSIAAANRDPEKFPEPHTFDVSRARSPHVSFGGGSHICIGLPLARFEVQAAVGRLFARFPTLRLAEPDASPAWKPVQYFRGLERLPVLV